MSGSDGRGVRGSSRSNVSATIREHAKGILA
jgi:hypothetical protein